MDYYYEQPEQQSAIVPAIVKQELSWLTPRTIVMAIGGIALLGAVALIARSSNATQEITRTGAPVDVKPDRQSVTNAILSKSKQSLDELKGITDLKIGDTKQAMLEQRASEFLAYANAELGNSKSECFRSELLQSCTLTKVISTHQSRLNLATSARNWTAANESLFEIEAARMALDGVQPKTPLTPAIVTAAILKENEARINLAEQSDNATAHTIFTQP